VKLYDKAFDEIRSSAVLSLGIIEHSNLSGCLESPVLSFKKKLNGEEIDLHGGPAITSYRDLDRDFVSVAFVTLNTEIIDDVTMKTSASTK